MSRTTNSNPPQTLFEPTMVDVMPVMSKSSASFAGPPPITPTIPHVADTSLPRGAAEAWVDYPTALRAACEQASAAADIPARMSAVLSEYLGVGLSGHFTLSNAGQVDLPPVCWYPEARDWPDSVTLPFQLAAVAAAARMQVWHLGLTGSPLSAVAIPIRVGGRPRWVWCGIVATARINREWLLSLELFAWVIGDRLSSLDTHRNDVSSDSRMVVDEAGNADAPDEVVASADGQRAEQLAALLELNASLLTAPEVTAAAGRLCRHLAAEFAATFALCTKGAAWQVAAVAGPLRAVHGADAAEELIAICEETALRATRSAWPPLAADDTYGLLLHRRFQERHQCSDVVSFPCDDELGTLQGVLLVFTSPDQVTADAPAAMNPLPTPVKTASNAPTGDPATISINIQLTPNSVPLDRNAEPPLGSKPINIDWLTAVALQTGATLTLLRRIERPAWYRGMTAVGKLLGRRWIWGLAPVVIGAGLMPYPDAVVCPCEVQPVTRRFVTAPFAGTLEHVVVEPGDVVDAGKCLARMDGRETRMELAAAEAERARAALQRDGHLARHDLGQAELARYEQERFAARTKLLTQRQSELEICSPIRGMVVAGDLRKVEGMPLKVGQTLFEIAPLDEMVFQLHVADEDIAAVMTGLETIVSLDAYPDQRFAGRLDRLHPRAERVEQTYVFVGEMPQPNADGLLRPGMRGVARIQLGYRPLGWVWLHKAWDRALRWFGY